MLNQRTEDKTTTANGKMCSALKRSSLVCIFYFTTLYSHFKFFSHILVIDAVFVLRGSKELF